MPTYLRNKGGHGSNSERRRRRRRRKGKPVLIDRTRASSRIKEKERDPLLITRPKRIVRIPHVDHKWNFSWPLPILLFFVVSVSVFPLDGGHCVGQQLSRPAAHAATNVNSSSLRHHLIANTTRGKKSPSLSAQLAPAARRFPQKI